jgi:hypothetical protein
MSGLILSHASRVLFWQNKSVGLSPRKISSFLQLVEKNLGLKMLGVYSIPCKCGQVNIG